MPRINQWYEHQGKPRTHCSAALSEDRRAQAGSNGELNHPFSSRRSGTRRRINLLVLTICLINLTMGEIGPKYEFRAVWVATAAPDFPLSYSVSAQQNEIRTMLDFLKANGLNTVIFQIRPGCDAFYDSNYEPWSHLLTGTSGQAPNPFYDPLAYFIDQAHQRGIELHAWFNPYRISTISNLSSLDPSHVYHQHPQWVLTITNRSENGGDTTNMYSNTLIMEAGIPDRDQRSTTVILDPGMAVVREYIINVFMDDVNRYQVDGVHMDDYFYPYGGIADEDAATFAVEPRGFTDIHDWRRDNINLFVQGIYDSIQVVKPWVKWGISPFGIWKNGYPPGIVGMSSYSAIYCDPMAWLNAGTVDYLTPQLYWPFGGPQDYGILMPWWADSTTTHDRHLYVGHAPYRISDYHNWPANELPNQIRLNRITVGCQGSVFFRLRNGMMNNPKGFIDSLQTDLYRYPAISPSMAWKDTIPPAPPCSVYVEITNDEHIISWHSPVTAIDGDTAVKYVVYRSLIEPIDIDDPSNIASIVPGNIHEYINSTASLFHYAVTALDQLSNESEAVSAANLSIDDRGIVSVPAKFLLYPNSPNPFNPTTSILYELNVTSPIELTILDLKGAQVATLVSEIQAPGSYTAVWNGTNQNGKQVAGGAYFYRLTGAGFSATRKLILLK